MRPPAWLRSSAWFLLVGSAAALTHLGVFAWLTHATTWWPELANAAGFGVAFGVSFTGHRWLSFADTGTSVSQSFVRFAGTAAAGFICNELSFIVLYRALDWPSGLALVAALVLAAGQTFVLSRYWSFRR